jgi:DNA-binding transcriptional ArsR family regulator
MDDLTPKTDFSPADVFVVEDLDTLKVLADPLRLRIRELLAEPRTVKQIAADLEMPPTKLYYHVNLLEKHDLIVMVETRVVSGIIEKRYRVSAWRVQVAKHLLSPAQAEDGATLALTPLFDTMRDHLLRAVKKGEIELDDGGDRHKGLSLFTGTLHLTDGQAADLYQRIEATLAEFSELSSKQQGHRDARFYRGFYALFPDSDKSTSSD